MKKHRIIFILIVLPIGLFSQKNCINTISGKELLNQVKVLSQPKMDGRLSGSKGYAEAANYVSNKFKEYGLKGLVANSYFQEFNLEYNQIENAVLRYNNGEETIIYELGEDFVCRGFSGSGDVSASMVFCGYGISNENYDDYAQKNVKNKIVLIFKKNPEWKIDDSDWEVSSIRGKVENAVEHGAIGVVFLSKPNDKNPQKPIGSVMHGEGIQYVNIPQIHVSLEVANEWFIESGLNFKQLQTKIDNTQKPHSEYLQGTVNISVEATYEKERKAMNVVGLLEGDDPKLKNEYLVIGAHLDHVGRQSGEVFFPGANDNASGIASILEIAKTFASCNTHPKRSLIFVAFAAEESGLEGSSFFASNCPVEKEKITAMLNMDCVGHGDSILIGCGKSYPKLYNIAKKQDSDMHNLMIKKTWKGGGADAEAFHKSGIPTLYFVATNSYTHLHLPSDTAETINTSLHEKITKLAFSVANEIVSGISLEKIR